MSYRHPMAGLPQADSNMGFDIPFLKDLEDKAQEYVEDAKQTLSDWGVSDSDIAKLESDAQKALEAEKAKAASDLLQQVTGAKGTFTPKSDSIVPTNVQEQIHQLNQNPFFAAIPGGVYTVAGAGLMAAAYFILRK